jgi:nucleotide-binding universal stress UspA family protein
VTTKTIVALVDFSETMPGVVRAAGGMARAWNATVYLVHVVDPRSDYDGDALRRDVSLSGLAGEIRHKRRDLRLAARVLGKLGTRAIARVVRGSPVGRALRELERRNPDLVVVGRRGRGRLSHLLPGHVGAAVARRAHCPVLIVPAGAAAGESDA